MSMSMNTVMVKRQTALEEQMLFQKTLESGLGSAAVVVRGAAKGFPESLLDTLSFTAIAQVENVNFQINNLRTKRMYDETTVMNARQTIVAFVRQMKEELASAGGPGRENALNFLRQAVGFIAQCCEQELELNFPIEDQVAHPGESIQSGLTGYVGAAHGTDALLRDTRERASEISAQRRAVAAQSGEFEAEWNELLGVEITVPRLMSMVTSKTRQPYTEEETYRLTMAGHRQQREQARQAQMSTGHIGVSGDGTPDLMDQDAGQHRWY